MSVSGGCVSPIPPNAVHGDRAFCAGHACTCIPDSWKAHLRLAGLGGMDQPAFRIRAFCSDGVSVCKSNEILSLHRQLSLSARNEYRRRTKASVRRLSLRPAGETLAPATLRRGYWRHEGTEKALLIEALHVKVKLSLSNF